MKRPIVVAALGMAQTLAWGSSYYLPAILADPIAQGLGLSRTTVFGLFSGALLLSAVLGPSVGRAIDNRGGRGVLALSNLVLATGLVHGFWTDRWVKGSEPIDAAGRYPDVPLTIGNWEGQAIDSKSSQGDEITGWLLLNNQSLRGCDFGVQSFGDRLRDLTLD